MTPYKYAFKDPINITDPTGKDGVVTGDGTESDPYLVKASMPQLPSIKMVEMLLQ